MEHVNGWCFRGIYKGGLWEDDLHVSAHFTSPILLVVIFTRRCFLDVLIESQYFLIRKHAKHQIHDLFFDYPSGKRSPIGRHAFEFLCLFNDVN